MIKGHGRFHIPVPDLGGERCTLCGAVRSKWKSKSGPWFLNSQLEPFCPKRGIDDKTR